MPDEWIDQVFAIMALTPRNTYQLLTKRAARMRDYFAAEHTAPNIKAWQARVSAAIDDIVPQRTDASRLAKMAVLAPEPLPNVWLGVSTERQQEADERIYLLLKTPAAVRFISAEPLLGRIDLTTLRPAGLTSHFDALRHGSTYTEHGAGQRFYHSSRQPTLDWVIVGGELRRRPQSGAFTDILTED